MEQLTLEVPAFVVYAGPRPDGDKYLYLYYAFASLDENTKDAKISGLKAHHFANKLGFKTSSIGSIHQVSFSTKSIHYNKNQAPVGHWLNEKLRAEWKAHEVGYNASKKLKADILTNHMIESLQPLRAAYREQRTEGRRAILAEIIRIITN